MVTCPYCDGGAELVTGAEIYPHMPQLSAKKFYRCASGCDAYVGCHTPTKFTDFKDDVPLGRLADPELRKAKSQAHIIFDKLWRDKHMSRSAAYARLAAYLKIDKDKCHIGMFDVQNCRKAVNFAKNLLGED